MKEEMTFEEIKEIIDLIRETDSVTAFRLKCGDVEIALSRTADGQLVVAPADSATPPAPPPSAPVQPAAAPAIPDATASPGTGPMQSASEIAVSEGEIVIKAPMVGSFYRCPKPGDPPFVEEGDAVKEDSVLCIIEVMKLMNSIEAKVSGTVARILVEDAQPVEHGQPLMVIKVDR